MKKISILLCLLWMGFIFYMSSNNGQISHADSTKVVSIVENTKKSIADNFGSKSTTNNSNTSQGNINKLDYIIRKDAHGFMYMVLALLVSNMIFNFNKNGKDAVIYILFICLFYAVTDEFHQAFVPGRTSLVSDVLVDFAGSLIGLLLFYLSYYIAYKKYLFKNN